MALSVVQTFKTKSNLKSLTGGGCTTQVKRADVWCRASSSMECVEDEAVTGVCLGPSSRMRLAPGGGFKAGDRRRMEGSAEALAPVALASFKYCLGRANAPHPPSAASNKKRAPFNSTASGCVKAEVDGADPDWVRSLAERFRLTPSSGSSIVITNPKRSAPACAPTDAHLCPPACNQLVLVLSTRPLAHHQLPLPLHPHTRGLRKSFWIRAASSKIALSSRPRSRCTLCAWQLHLNAAALARDWARSAAFSVPASYSCPSAPEVVSPRCAKARRVLASAAAVLVLPRVQSLGTGATHAQPRRARARALSRPVAARTGGAGRSGDGQSGMSGSRHAACGVRIPIALDAANRIALDVTATARYLVCGSASKPCGAARGTQTYISRTSGSLKPSSLRRLHAGYVHTTFVAHPIPALGPPALRPPALDVAADNEEDVGKMDVAGGEADGNAEEEVQHAPGYSDRMHEEDGNGERGTGRLHGSGSAMRARGLGCAAHACGAGVPSGDGGGFTIYAHAALARRPGLKPPFTRATLRASGL
ncbi:hypothetical protein C8F04DRAFT_1360483 [Mycena alexandri]|uniref:Uncharacterized protein n=1 Tax=Mycena alexandri TaxID=1745969 RepID=A0AAD6SQF9_9AGAR|nr:hypothetical protein C8F04DRAFT_1360483 [Mycena alexandri]